jgi:hypothetical protein
VQKICEKGQSKNPRDTGTSLAAKIFGEAFSSCQERAKNFRFCRLFYTSNQKNLYIPVQRKLLFGYTAENSHHLKARIISKDPLF